MKAADKAMGKPDMGDQGFIQEAAKGGMMEVEMGKMATEARQERRRAGISARCW